VSASIDEDEYFNQVMDSSWNLSGQAATYQQYDQGWTNQRPGTATEKVYQYKNLDPYSSSNPHWVDTTLWTGLESADNPWKTTENFYGSSSPRKSISNPKHH